MLFLKGGAIVPTGPVIQHVGEASPTDTVTLLIALDEAGKQSWCFSSDHACMLMYYFLPFILLSISGKATGDLYEDEGDGYGYKNGDYLITHYEAEKVDSHEVVIRVASVQGQRERPRRTLHVRLLIGENVQV